jgi:hydroxymethylpyrimidine kinase/phosphomethylpyrimidine kinase
MRVALTIAGFDPSGGAGTLADIKTFAALGCFGVAGITSLTYQNTLGVYGASHQTPEILRAQLEPLHSDFRIAAVKLGMLPTQEIIHFVAKFIASHRLTNVVLDPVVRSTSGHDLIDDRALGAIIRELLPLATVVTPNMAEAERMTGLHVTTLDEMRSAGEKILSMGARAVLVKGGHLTDQASDLLLEGVTTRLYHAERVETKNTHGTGCTLSSAIAALLARGLDLQTSIDGAKQYLLEALKTAPAIGHGAGPLNHMVQIKAAS